MYTFSKIEKKYPKVNRALVIIISLLTSITALISSVKFTLNFTVLYKFDINFFISSSKKLGPRNGLCKLSIFWFLFL